MKIIYSITGVLMGLTLSAQTPNTIAATSQPQPVVLKINEKIVDQISATPSNFAISDAVPITATRRELPDTTIKCTITFPDPVVEEKKKTDPKKNPK